MARYAADMRLSALACALVALSACAPAGGETGGRLCVADRDCGDLVCAATLDVTPADLAPLPLACAEAEAAAAPGEACEAAEDCDRGVCLLAGACARSCERDDDCAEAQRCQATYARTSPERLALVRTCVDHANLPEGGQLEVVLARDALHGARDTLRLPLFAPTTLYVVEHLNDDSWPIPTSTSLCRPPLCARTLRAEDTPRDALFEVEHVREQPEGPQLPIAQGAYAYPLTVWAPNGPRVSAEPRAYALEVESKVAGDARISALARDGRGTRLDLNLYYVGVDGLAPEGERGPPPLAAALDEVDRIFEPAGIALGDIRQNLIPGALPARGSGLPNRAVSAGFRRLVSQYQVLPELPELLRLSAGAANAALDVFLVADIDSRAGGDVNGLSAGTPVAFGMHGTGGSGIVIAAEMFLRSGDTRALGRSLAHEIGHALGLFHTTELDGLVMDPLPDTPSCTLDRDRDASGTLDAGECAAHGGDNLMFPTSDAGSRLTPEQSAVLQSALILR